MHVDGMYLGSFASRNNVINLVVSQVCCFAVESMKLLY